jgi:acetyl-CoA carboxylase, biotin carboxylase subunit
MFKKILVANRGEIALRILRSCKELGIPTVAVHSTADQESLHVKFADESVCLGPPPAGQSYLNIPAILSAAEITGADAVHPGYGFLSENPNFAAICRQCGIAFIGPTEENVVRMGDKVEAKRAAKEAGLPILESVEANFETEQEALAALEAMGLPLIIKAGAGGGGRGMKIVGEKEQLWHTLQSARSEALAAFGNANLYLERYLVRPRHIEFQLAADNYGATIHLGERECSVQRRFQKLIEESPSAAMTPELRAKMGEMAVRVTKSIGYRSMGTVEFLLDSSGRFFFLEMNTRIQVEHPVTEMVSGLDLVRLQIELAAGAKLPLRQADVASRGHAIECRINAEDSRKFLRSCGEVTTYHPPGGIGVRVDSALYEGLVVSPYYDSLLAKLIVHAPDRQQAIRRMQIALDEFIIDGLSTNISFHQKMLRDERFLRGDLHTQMLSEKPVS